ncbi:HTH-type transcriptional regulator BetI [Amycolatopsis sp. M39]|nr:HTH-type transcriptional regulator BetI [Amycolatopsis sp. M39]
MAGAHGGVPAVKRGAHVLDAVLTVLAEQGIGSLSVRTVAAAAGVSPAQVQYYYRTKNDLVRAGFEYAGEQFLAEIEAARPKSIAGFVELWLPLDEPRARRARVWLAYAAAAVVDPVLRKENANLDRELRQWCVGAGLSEDVAAQVLAMIDGVTLQCLSLPMAERRALADRTVGTFLAALPE